MAALVSCSTVPGVTTAPASTSSTRTPVDFARLEREVLFELNSARDNPQSYAANLTPLLPLFSGNRLRRPGWPVAVQTSEGPSAVREAIDALGSQPRVATLTLSDAMSKAARDLANDQRRTGAVGHTSSDGASPEARLARYGTWGGSYSENADYGSVISGRDVIEDMIIDDGVPDRGHRRNTFDPGARVVGIGCAPHPKYGVVCVIDQAGSFVPR
ncbi:MAG: allergen V5/Tpx family protein [Gemmatimonadetes bacterium]|nr:allergen V5/Tpx family protein [Gemmatimonadota bacterium]